MAHRSTRSIHADAFMGINLFPAEPMYPCTLPSKCE